MQIDKRLANFIRTRRVFLIRGIIALIIIAIAFAGTLQHSNDEYQRSYDVDMAVGVMLPGGTINGEVMTTPIITVLVRGGEDIASLESLTISINNITVGEMDPPGKATIRWKGARQHFPVQEPNGNHVVATGHFSDGKDLVLTDTTV